VRRHHHDQGRAGDEGRTTFGRISIAAHVGGEWARSGDMRICAPIWRRCRADLCRPTRRARRGRPRPLTPAAHPPPAITPTSRRADGDTGRVRSTFLPFGTNLGSNSGTFVARPAVARSADPAAAGSRPNWASFGQHRFRTPGAVVVDNPLPPRGGVDGQCLARRRGSGRLRQDAVAAHPPHTGPIPDRLALGDILEFGAHRPAAPLARHPRLLRGRRLADRRRALPGPGCRSGTPTGCCPASGASRRSTLTLAPRRSDRVRGTSTLTSAPVDNQPDRPAIAADPGSSRESPGTGPDFVHR